MIYLSSRQLELLNQPVINSFLCVSLKNLKLTTYQGNLTLSDGVYVSTDLILEAEEPQLTSAVDRDLYKITFADDNRVLLTNFEAGLNGAPVSVRVGLIDYYTNEPDTTALFIVYDGIIESYEYVVDTNIEGSVRAIVTCSNLMASLDDSKPYYTSKDFVKRISPTDTSYDQIYEGSGAVVLRWGKKE